MENISIKEYVESFDKIMYQNGTELRIIFQKLIQELINYNDENKGLLEDIKFLIFDYLDNYEHTILELKGEQNEYL